VLFGALKPEGKKKSKFSIATNLALKIEVIVYINAGYTFPLHLKLEAYRLHTF
jgi:hypothetical protein